MFASLWFRKEWIAAILTAWALTECYTRLYLGVHYLSDVLFGAFIGTLMACAFYFLSRWICRELKLP